MRSGVPWSMNPCSIESAKFARISNWPGLLSDSVCGVFIFAPQSTLFKLIFTFVLHVLYNRAVNSVFYPLLRFIGIVLLRQQFHSVRPTTTNQAAMDLNRFTLLLLRYSTLTFWPIILLLRIPFPTRISQTVFYSSYCYFFSLWSSSSSSSSVHVMCVHSTSRVSAWNFILLVLGHVFIFFFVAVLNLTVSILYLHVLFFFFIFSRSLSVWAASVR